MNLRHRYSTFPNSWFRIATSEELPTRGVLPLRYFDRDFVLFRTEEGTPCLLDAHCPHMGANLSFGGSIEGNTIRCPYHGWKWNSEGCCVEIPYADKLPSKAQIPSWPVREINGLILMYYHNQGKLPDWEVPELPEYTSKNWTPLRSVRRWKVRAKLQDYMENSVDVAHLYNLHSQTFKAAKSNRVEIDGPRLTHHMIQEYNVSTLVTGLLIKEANGEVTTTYYGPAYDISYYQTKGKVQLQFLTIFTGTPLDQDYLDIEIYYSVKKVLPPPLNLILDGLVKQDVIATFEQDLPILENKTDLTNPLLYEGDGPLKKCWQWMPQFYPVETEKNEELSVIS